MEIDLAANFTFQAHWRFFPTVLSRSTYRAIQNAKRSCPGKAGAKTIIWNTA